MIADLVNIKNYIFRSFIFHCYQGIRLNCNFPLSLYLSSENMMEMYAAFCKFVRNEVRRMIF